MREAFGKIDVLVCNAAFQMTHEHIGQFPDDQVILKADGFPTYHLAVVVGGTFGVVLWVVAAIMLATGIVRVCPLYLPFKISTNKGA